MFSNALLINTVLRASKLMERQRKVWPREVSCRIS